MPIFDRDHADSPEKAYVYILRCADGTLYCGWTNDLAARLDAHNSGKGAKYTRGRGPVELAYSEMFDTQSEAMHREAEIKKLSRPQKQALLDSQTGGEMLTVYDAADRPCGARPRRIVHAQGLRHHVCHLWVVGVRDGVRGIWLQRRQNDRPLYPGFYDLTATGHMDPGETPLTAALRDAYSEAALGMLDGGADVRVVQELLGHASVTTTQIYTKVTPDTLREVYATSHPRARRDSAARTAAGAARTGAGDG